MNKVIPLQNGGFALVDDQDFDRLAGLTWYARRSARDKTSYARANAGGERLSMHRLVLDCPRGSEVDHINGDGLDNRRSNLRICTRRENMVNRSRARSGYRGAYPRGGRWKAAIVVNGRQCQLGWYGSELEAAAAYDIAARECNGEYARLNFPASRDWLLPFLTPAFEARVLSRATGLYK